MKHWLILMGILGGAFAGVARGEPYWVAWEGNDFPENEGWERYHYGAKGPSADRSLTGGIMTLDGLASIEIVDGYRLDRPLDPGPGEEFVVRWGLRVNEVASDYPYDPGLAVYSDDAWHFVLVIGVDEVHSVLEQEEIGFEPGVFHAWEFRSRDMRSYTLLVDGSVIRTGSFLASGAVESRVDWGDVVAGANSHSDWDYFRFGVVPEPASWVSLLALFCGTRVRHTERNKQ